MKRLPAALLVAVLGAYATSAFSQPKPQQLVKQRQAKMILQGKYFLPLALMAHGKIPYNARAASRDAGFLAALSKMAWDAFDPSTAGVKDTRALPKIYKEPAKFKQAQENLEGKVAKLVSATRSGNEASVKAATLEVGKACGACHQNFRAKR